MDTGERTWLNLSAAAKRANLDRRTIRRWHQQGMPTEWRDTADGQREVVVDEETLLAWKRRKNSSNPAQFYRLRKRLTDFGAPAPELPAEIQAQRARRAARRAVEPLSDDQEPGDLQVAWEAILRELPKLRASVEYDSLDAALRDAEPGCRDVESFTAEEVDPDELPVMRAICAACDVLERCQAFAIAEKPKLGFWAGRTARELRRDVTRDA